MFIPPRAYVFISLNAVRALSIIALVLVFASNIVVMVEDIKAVRSGSTSVTTTDSAGHTETFDCDYFENSTVPNQPAGAFWAIVNRLFILALTTLMALSEIGRPQRFFLSYLPVLGQDFGVGVLGGMQWITAASILSHHVDVFPLVAGFFLFVIGCFNIILGLAFGASIKDKRSITTFRETKAKELLPGSRIRVLQTSTASVFSGNEKASLFRYDTDRTHSSESGRVRFGPGYGFARQGEKRAAQNGFTVTRPVESLPRYHGRPPSGAESEPEEPVDVNEYRRNVV